MPSIKKEVKMNGRDGAAKQSALNNDFDILQDF